MTADSQLDPDRLVHLTRRLAVPRRVGTAGERQVVQDVTLAFTQAGLTTTQERFPVGLSAQRYGTLLAFLGAAVLVVLGVAIVHESPMIAASCALASGFLVNAPWRVTRALSDRWRSRVWSSNLVAAPIDDLIDAPARVIFLAHHDSKSQRLPTGVRVALVLSVTAGSVLLAVLSAIEAVAPHWPAGPFLMAVLSTLVLSCLLGLSINTSGNRSPGAIDNASGLAVLLELARWWRPRPIASADYLFVATGAEEVGLDGARAFLQRHEWWLREKPTLLINLESVGTGSLLFLAGEHSAVALAHRVAIGLGLPTGRFRVLGAGMDHEPFQARGLAAVSLLGDVVSVSAALHSSRDTMQGIDRHSLSRAALLAAHLAWAWADFYQDTDPERIHSDEDPDVETVCS